MRKWFVSFGLACGGLIAAAASVSAQVQVQQAPDLPLPVQIEARVQIADRIMPGGFGAPALYMPTIKLGQADAIVVGRVIAIEPMDVPAAPAAGQPKVNYRIAVVQVSEPIHGVKKGIETI